MKDDGGIIGVNSLYHGVVQATGSKTGDPETEALLLREKVKNEVSCKRQGENLLKFTDALNSLTVS